MHNDLYRYMGCGLDNVYLRNGYSVRTAESGEEFVNIENIDGLHRAIAKGIIDSAPSLDAKTFKFLRKELDMSQRQIAAIVGVEEQTVSLWERAKNPIPQHAEILLRALVKETISGNAELKKLITKFNSLDREVREMEASIELERDPDGSWQRFAA